MSKPYKKSKKYVTPSGRFLALFIVISVIVLIILGIIWSKYRSSSNQTMNSINQNPTNPMIDKAELDKSIWKKYSNTNTGYEFSYPNILHIEESTWGMNPNDDFYGWIASITFEDKSGKKYMFYPICPGLGSIELNKKFGSDCKPTEAYPEYYIIFYSRKHTDEDIINMDLEHGEQYSFIKNIQIGGQKANIYMTNATNYKKGKIFTVLTYNNYDYLVSYSHYGAEEDAYDKFIPLYDQILSTIKFNPPLSEQKSARSQYKIETPTPFRINNNFNQ